MIYMDEKRFERGPRLSAVAAEMTRLVAALAEIDPAVFAAA